MKIGIVSLGCDKNRVDTELMLGEIREHEFTPNPREADIIIVNTCGFIESAKQESINTILEMAQYKKSGLKGLIVTGCLSARYADALVEELPEVDVFLGVTAHEKINQAINSIIASKKMQCFEPPHVRGNYSERLLTSEPNTSYIKIAEGCNNRCTYCAIPLIRGNYQSRKPADILSESRAMVSRGVSELIFVAQDSTRYGSDLPIKSNLDELILKVAKEARPNWLRVLYCYPESVTERLLDTMAKLDNVVKYLDMPVQHLADSVLKRMHRRVNYEKIAQICSMAKERGFVLRTTILVGFPGETQSEFDELASKIKVLEFDRLGVFAYSQEEGTPAATMPEQVDEDIKQERAEEIMHIQESISKKLLEWRIGNEYDVLIENVKNGIGEGRTFGEAPGADGLVFVEGATHTGFCRAKIYQTNEHDMFATILEERT